MTRRELLLSFVAAIAAGKVAMGSEQQTEWDNPNLEEFDAIIRLARDGMDPEEIYKRLVDLRPYVVYAFGLDPRD